MTDRELMQQALEALEDACGGRCNAENNPCWQRDIANALRGRLAQPEQRPVAWMHTKIDDVVVPHRPADLDRHPDRWEALYKNTPPCQTCEALARTVMLDQTSHDTNPQQRKPLDEIAVFDLADQHMYEGGKNYGILAFARAIEAAHGIKGET